jgi:hypothetical protein
MKHWNLSFLKGNIHGHEQPKIPNTVKTFDQRLEELAEQYIGTQRAFKEETIPLYSEESTGRIYREILGVKIEGQDKYSLSLGKELILGRDIELIQGNPRFEIIAPYQTGHSMYDTMLKAVELGNLVRCDYVFPNDTGAHIVGKGFRLNPYLINKK